MTLCVTFKEVSSRSIEGAEQTDTANKITNFDDGNKAFKQRTQLTSKQ